MYHMQVGVIDQVRLALSPVGNCEVVCSGEGDGPCEVSNLQDLHHPEAHPVHLPCCRPFWGGAPPAHAILWMLPLAVSVDRADGASIGAAHAPAFGCRSKEMALMALTLRITTWPGHKSCIC